MTKFLPTFSRLDVAHHCVYPWVARDLRWPKQPPDKFRGMGRAISSVAECLAVWGEAPLDAIAETEGLTDGDKKRLERMTIHLRELLDEEAKTDRWRKTEVALAYHVPSGTAREPIRKHHRDYSDQRDDELMGTPDLIRCTEDGRIVVRDYKSGNYKRGHDPGETRQLRALGLAAARCYGANEVTVELAQVDEGRVWVESVTLDAFELACCADELRAIHSRVAEGPREPPKPGAWCTESYCPIVAVCPSTEKALAAIAEASSLQHPLTVEIQSSEHAAYTLERLDAADKAIALIRESVKQYVRENGPLSLPDGRLYGAVLKDGRERFDLSVPGAREAIERHLGAFNAATAIDYSTSKSAIQAAAKLSQTKRGEGVKIARALFDELRELGALKKGAPYEAFEKFTPREEAAE